MRTHSEQNRVAKAAHLGRGIIEPFGYNQYRAKSGHGDNLKKILKDNNLGSYSLPVIYKEIQRQSIIRHKRIHLPKDCLSIHQKLVDKRKSLITNTLRSTGLGWDTININLSTNNEVSAKYIRGICGYNVYGSYPHYEYTLNISLPYNWITKVDRNKLRFIDGMFTMDADLVHSNEDIKVFRASWLHKNQGYNVSVISGFIATINGISYHSTKSLKDSINGLMRKKNITPERREKLREQLNKARNTISFKLLNKVDADRTFVSINDAKAVGACIPGISNWCNTVGIDIERGFCSLKEVIEGFKTYPLPEVRQTIIYVIKNNS